MKIINTTRNQCLAENVLIADTVSKRLVGLLNKKSFSPPEALIIKPSNSIHTFFMRFPIDVIFLDRHNRVIKIIPEFKPFHLSAFYFKAVLVVELPAGRIAATLTQVGDMLSFPG